MRSFRPFLNAVVVAAVVITSVVAAADVLHPSFAVAQAAPRYRAPVIGAIVDHFRPPSRPYGPGNLGVAYRTDVDAFVTASAAGVVTFAGSVGHDSFVVISHDDGLRTTYGFLSSVSVVAGNAVAAGQPVGTSGGLMHFGIRRGSTYIDPERLLRGIQMRSRLVPNR